MQFNIEKCKVMHMGRKKPKHQYTMAGKALNVTTEEKDIWVIICDNLKPSLQCTVAAKMANSILARIMRTFHY